MGWVASLQDLYDLGGLPPEAYVRDARQVAAIYFAQNLIELPGHGVTGSPVRIVPKAGATMPAGVSPTSWYTATGSDRDFFGLQGVTLTDAGTGTLSVLEDITPKLLERLAARTSWVIAHAKAYAGPWTTPPGWAPQLVAALVAFDAAIWLRLPSARFPIDDLRKVYDEAQKFVEEVLDKGEPMGDGVGPIDATPAVAEMGAVLVRPIEGPFRAPPRPRGALTVGPFGAHLGRERDRV